MFKLIPGVGWVAATGHGLLRHSLVRQVRVSPKMAQIRVFGFAQTFWMFGCPPDAVKNQNREWGQTGADRAALDFALAHDVPHGGWCPKGRRAEDGQLAPCYRLEETPSSEYLERTEWNVRDSDGTVIFSTAAILSGGSKRTLQLAFKLERPVLHLARDDPQRAPEVRLVSFIEQHHIKVVNVAGPRASEEPEVAAWVREVLEKAWDLGGL